MTTAPSYDSARTRPAPAFPLPDLTTSLPAGPVETSPAALAEAERITASAPAELFACLLADQESESALIAARRVLTAFLTPAPEDEAAPGDASAATANTAATAADADAEAEADAVAAHVLAARADLAAALAPLRDHDDPAIRAAVLRQRAPSP
ncbi:hypothetical protein [Streptomyces cirratus]|uniref:hypothetical protein n=1 Tax=Streptomyces cirratus TaxID=68187 RepID=UPI003613E6B9